MKPDSRRERRFAVQLPTAFGESAQREHGTVLNISAQGCAMTADQVPAVSTYVSLRINLLTGEEPVDVELAGVRWVSGYRCGLEFIRLAPESLGRLRSFVSLLERTP